MIEITHSREEGTLVDGTARGDGAGDILKAHCFRWSRKLGIWFRPRSRGRLADRYRVEQAPATLREAGFEVKVSEEGARRAQVTS